MLARRSLLQVINHTVMHDTVNLRGDMFVCSYEFELDKGFYFYLGWSTPLQWLNDHLSDLQSYTIIHGRSKSNSWPQMSKCTKRSWFNKQMALLRFELRSSRTNNKCANPLDHAATPTSLLFLVIWNLDYFVWYSITNSHSKARTNMLFWISI
jgi:hypothetical protein